MLRDIYERASPEQIDKGRDWYDAYRRVCRNISTVTGTPLKRVVAVACITSPNTQLRTNIAFTLAICHSGGVLASGRYPNRMQAKYRPVLEGVLEPEVALKGDKVLAFYRAIFGDQDAVVLDRHALRSAGYHGRTPTRVQYHRIANLYREVAAQVGESPRDLQAIVWKVVRSEAGPNLVDIHDLEVQ